MKTLAAVLVLAAALTAPAALAADDVVALSFPGTGCPDVHATVPHDTMDFTVKTVGQSRVMIVNGAIAEGDAKRLETALNKAGRIDEVWLHSTGGTASEGPLIGRVLRARNLATRVPNNYICVSACSIAFLGGIVRRIDPGGIYGVHTFRYDKVWDDIIDISRQDFSGHLSKPDQKVYTAGHDIAGTGDSYDHVMGAINDYKDAAIRNYLHEQEQQNALLAADLAVYMQEMGIERNILKDVILSQKAADYTTSDEYNQYFNQRYPALQRKGVSYSQAQEQVKKAFNAEHKTFVCPTRDQMHRYNIINVD